MAALKAGRRRDAAPAGVRVGEARAAAVVVEGIVLPIESDRRGRGIPTRVGTACRRRRCDDEHDTQSTKTHKPRSPTSSRIAPAKRHRLILGHYRGGFEPDSRDFPASSVIVPAEFSGFGEFALPFGAFHCDVIEQVTEHFALDTHVQFFGV